MHDAITAEQRGTPAVAVVTEAFVDMAELMAEACGVPGYRFAVVGHPFSSNGPEVLKQKAKDAVAQIVEVLSRRR